MRRTFTFVLLILFASIKLTAQSVGINNSASQPDPSAILDVSATDKGMLIPRMTTAERIAITTPAVGLFVFDTDANGFWFYDGLAWKSISAQPAPAINFRYYASTSQGINANTNTKVNFTNKSFLNNADFANSTFTAPVSGIYNLITSLSIYGNNAASLGVSVLVNGIAKGSPSYYIINGVFQEVGFSDNVELTAGDQLYIQVNASAVIAIVVGQGTFFTGFKIN